MKIIQKNTSLLLLLYFITFLTFPALAKEPAYSESADVIKFLGQQNNVGPQVIQGLEKSKLIRVYVGVKTSNPALNGVGAANATDDQQRIRIAATRESLVASMEPGSFQLMRQFENIPGFAIMATAEAVARLSRQSEVWRIDLDEGGSGNAMQAQPLASIDLVNALGFKGEGMTVAVIDSGYDSDHVDLADSLVGEQCFCDNITGGGVGCCPNGETTQSGTGAAEDDNGHGTSVSGIITSNGTTAPAGAAPEADIVAIKVLNSANSFCCNSDVIAALDWIISNRPDVDVVNMSLSTNVRFSGDCDNNNAWTLDYATAINALAAKGVPVVAAAGNNGSGVDMSAPACIKNAISVGAVWDSDVGSKSFSVCTDTTTQADKVTCFSNSSTSTDVFAPGAPYTSTGINGGTSTYSGTSQAAPTVAACLALALQESPGLSFSELESAVKRTDKFVTDTTNGLSFPRLNCYLATGGIFVDGFE